MKPKVPTLWFLAVLALPGCVGKTDELATATPPPTLTNLETVAAALPAGVTLETKVTDKDGDDSETVRDVLARYKVKLKKRKICDANGREIHFHKTELKGLAINTDREYNKLRKRYTVVLLAGP